MKLMSVTIAAQGLIFSMLGLQIGGSHNIDANGTGTIKASMIADQAENVFRILHDGGCGVAGTPSWPRGVGSEGTSIASYAGSAEAIERLQLSSLLRKFEFIARAGRHKQVM